MCFVLRVVVDKTDCAWNNNFSKLSHLGPVTRSRSRVAVGFELNCSLGNSANQLNMTSPEVAEKLSELFKVMVIEKSVRSIEENKETLTETTKLGIRHRRDLVEIQKQQQANWQP